MLGLTLCATFSLYIYHSLDQITILSKREVPLDSESCVSVVLLENAMERLLFSTKVVHFLQLSKKIHCFAFSLYKRI